MTVTAVEVADSRPAMLFKEKIERGIGIALLLGVTAWLVWNFFTSPTQFVNVGLAGLRLGAIYALIALGYTLVYGIIELINFAHGDLFMLGSVFSSIILVTWFGAGTGGAANWGLMLVTLVIVMAGCAGINVTAERVAYRRLRRAPKLAPLITAVGLSFIFQWVGLRLNGSSQKNWPKVIPDGGISFGDITLDYSTITVIALGGAMAGAAGLLYLETFGTTRFDAGFQLGLIAFTAAVLGGIGNLQGAVLGGVLIGLIQGFNDGLPHGFGQRWSQSVVFTILILLMVFKPEGILGKPTVEKV
jgi:branched-chain amino acid transport system permease protein